MKVKLNLVFATVTVLRLEESDFKVLDLDHILPADVRDLLGTMKERSTSKTDLNGRESEVARFKRW